MGVRTHGVSDWPEFRDDPGPKAGHTFRISVQMRGASGIQGPDDPEPHSYADSGYATEMHPVYVRAHNLPDALEIASRVPLTAYLDDPPPEPSITTG